MRDVRHGFMHDLMDNRGKDKKSMRLKRTEEMIEMVENGSLGDLLADDQALRRLRICLKNARLVQYGKFAVSSQYSPLPYICIRHS